MTTPLPALLHPRLAVGTPLVSASWGRGPGSASFNHNTGVLVSSPTQGRGETVCLLVDTSFCLSQFFSFSISYSLSPVSRSVLSLFPSTPPLSSPLPSWLLVLCLSHVSWVGGIKASLPSALGPSQLFISTAPLSPPKLGAFGGRFWLRAWAEGLFPCPSVYLLQPLGVVGPQLLP